MFRVFRQISVQSVTKKGGAANVCMQKFLTGLLHCFLWGTQFWNCQQHYTCTLFLMSYNVTFFKKRRSLTKALIKEQNFYSKNILTRVLIREENFYSIEKVRLLARGWPHITFSDFMEKGSEFRLKHECTDRGMSRQTDATKCIISAMQSKCHYF